jgi:hypothetical protein
MKTQKNMDMAMVQRTQIFVEQSQWQAARCRAPKWMDGWDGTVARVV